MVNSSYQAIYSKAFFITGLRMLNEKWVADLSCMLTPEVDINYIENLYRHDIISCADDLSCVGIELGVAKGIFSKRMIESGKFISYYGVDLYSDIHDTEEYKNALKYIGLSENYKLLRMSFDDALDLFDDEYFDFIYIDGFAHTGEEGGKSIADWFCKLKNGGVLAGDDYHSDWPLVKWAVNDFVKKTGLTLNVMRCVENIQYCKYPTWFVVKEKNIRVEPNEILMKVAMLEKERIHNERILRMKK
jgi:hypothetical protein